MSIFNAGVQYNDFKGTVAADRADEISMRDFLIEEGIANDTERVIGYRIAFGGNHGAEIETPGVVIYLQEGSFDDPSRIVRAVEVSMTAAKFFSFFKRFDLVMTQKDLSLEGVEVDGPHYE
ncbi:hypothetical protein [Falsiphaeobacter marinintestinus]|uniref:hypothetical protein n=1 Tax=Falsiphaeobacter marinintestinus TaxID=1492905 RepID=UPI0011B5107D|nr:hypothetical protein [Phaeobacter marinintestinus]